MVAGLKACPYGHTTSPATGSAAPGSPLPTSLDFCKTLPKQFKSMCRRATPPGACTRGRSGLILPAHCLLCPCAFPHILPFLSGHLWGR